MKRDEVPNEWVDAAMKGASPGCQDDARFYLANAYDAVVVDVEDNVNRRLQNYLDEHDYMYSPYEIGQLIGALSVRGPWEKPDGS